MLNRSYNKLESKGATLEIWLLRSSINKTYHCVINLSSETCNLSIPPERISIPETQIKGHVTSSIQFETMSEVS